MHSPRLREGLTEFVESVASHLQAEIDLGAEVPFEVGSRSGRGERPGGRAGGRATLYSYRALTGTFIAEREAELERLPAHAEAVRLLEGFDGLDRYLANTGLDVGRARGHTRARAAIAALLEDVFHEQTDFAVRPERLQAAFERLERSAIASTSDVTLVATLHGLTITSAELSVTTGLTIAHPDALEGMPGDAGWVGDGEGEDHPIVVLTLRDGEDSAEGDVSKAVAQGREVLGELLRALRLFGDGRVTLGALAWARVGEGSWTPLALGTGGAPHGMLVVTAEQEDELRAFCNLISRRAPHGNELAWALRRFELGCEREKPYEGLSDHLLALRALLEPEGPSSGLLAGRLAALCATPEHRVALTERIVAAVALERAMITGKSVKRAGGQALSREVADHLRALLRDVICGHLAPDLPALADELLAAPEDAEDDAQPVPEPVLI
jgi:hypothetical protein